jgi:hypothetical protein
VISFGSSGYAARDLGVCKERRVMGKNLYYTIPQFFERRMQEHSAVLSFRLLPNDNEIIYEIRRRNFGDTIRVWLSDQYNFGESDFNNRPREIRAGDYILIARPEAHGGDYSEDKIRIGKLADFMGALTKRQMWKYEPPSEEERKRRAAKRQVR